MLVLVKSTSPSTRFNPGEQTTSGKPGERGSLGLGDKESMDTKVLRKKEFDGSSFITCQLFTYYLDLYVSSLGQ